MNYLYVFHKVFSNLMHIEVTMRNILVIPLFFALVYNVKAQDVVPDFGKVSMEEMQMKECSFDKNAAAMVLLDVQETKVTENKMISERRIRIKIFNKEGYKHASILIPFVSKKRASKITDLSAYTYNLDSAGKIISTKISKNDIFRKSEEGITSIRFAFPDVKPGTVIEYRFEKTEKNIFHFEPWYFQSSIPTKVSYIKMSLPLGYNITQRVVSNLNIVTDSKTDRKNYPPLKVMSFLATEIPAFRIEPFMSSLKDNLQRIDFSYAPSFGWFNITGNESGWQLINLALYRHSPLGIESKGRIIGTIPVIDSISKLRSDTAKINAVYNYVKHRVHWNEERSFYAEDVQGAWNSMSGNSAEINVIILNILRKVGVRSFPIMVSTRDHGKVDRSFANLGQFNNVDVLAFDTLGQYYVLDGTLKQSYRVPPLNIINSLGFVVDSAKGLWVNIEDTRPLLKTVVSAFATINEQGEIEGNASVTYFDLARIDKLNEKKEDEDEDNYIQKDFSGFKIDSLKEENLEDDSQPLINRFKFRLHLNQTDKFLFLDPFLLSSMQKNPFKDSIRISDLHFGANMKMIYNLSLNLPEGMMVEELPKSSGIRMADTSIAYTRRLELRGNLLMVQSSLEFKRCTFDKEEYPFVKQVFDKIYALNAEQVVLKNKE